MSIYLLPKIQQLKDGKFGKLIKLITSEFRKVINKESSLASLFKRDWILHLIIGLVFIITFISLVFFLRKAQKLDFLDNSIQLLSQIIAVIVGFLSIGSSIYLTSYDASETLNTLQQRLEKIMSTIRKTWYGNRNKRHKVTKGPFRNYLINSIKISFLDLFFNKQGEQWPLFIYRYYMDGVWYNNIESSRLAEIDNASKHSVQSLHEVYICAFKVLTIVQRIRNSGSALVFPNNCTQGSTSFINDLDTLNIKEDSPLPFEETKENAKKIITMAIRSQHYMEEEIRDHTENENWEPYQQSKFQFATTDYLLWLIYFINKLYLLRLSHLETKYPEILSKLSKESLEKFDIKPINNLKTEIFSARDKVTVVYGKSRYFRKLKRSSIPGIGLSSIVLFIVLFTWPFLKASSINAQIIGFSLLYSMGIASLLESSFFYLR